MQTNHGRLNDLCIGGEDIGWRVQNGMQPCGTSEKEPPDKGSCIVILATDLPLSDRQLKRVIRRCSVGLARLGSFIGHGSGEAFLGFSTANRVTDDAPAIYPVQAFNDSRIDPVFRAAAECTEEAVLNSLAAAEIVTGPTELTRRALTEFLKNG